MCVVVWWGSVKKWVICNCFLCWSNTVGDDFAPLRYQDRVRYAVEWCLSVCKVVLYRSVEVLSGLLGSAVVKNDKKTSELVFLQSLHQSCEKNQNDGEGRRRRCFSRFLTTTCYVRLFVHPCHGYNSTLLNFSPHKTLPIIHLLNKTAQFTAPKKPNKKHLKSTHRLA